MIDYRSGDWGFHVAIGVRGSLAPRALAMAIPNAAITFIITHWFVSTDNVEDDKSKMAQLVVAAGSTIMLFILYNRSRTSYNRWWEGGTLLQKARGEWFNAFSSILAFTSTKPELQDQVDQYVHFTARLMSLLMCCALQQVSPNRNRPFEIIGLEGIEPASMEFLNSAPDKVEIILQWIQRSMVLHMHTGVLPAPPPILSRAFQEVSRGIVNLQNARKIADFPYPYPLAQISMILQILHYAATPIVSAMAVPPPYAVPLSFLTIFTLWCIHFNAIELEFPFGSRANDLPMNEFQQDWNKSVQTLVHRKAACPPQFEYDASVHDELAVQMSDASELYIPSTTVKSNRSSVSRILIKTSGKRKRSWYFKPDQTRFNVHNHKRQVEAAGSETCSNSLSHHGPVEGRDRLTCVLAEETIQLTSRRERSLTSHTSHPSSASRSEDCNSGISSDSLRVVQVPSSSAPLTPNFHRGPNTVGLPRTSGLEPLDLDRISNSSGESSRERSI